MYRYQPLDLSSESIRVLRLDPAKNVDEPLTGWIYTMEIARSKPLQLSAISYAAEGQSPRRRYKFTCFDRTGSREGQLYLTKSASDAMKAVRSRDSFRRVWIDVVCIDHSNLDEKNHQARVAGAVFSRARTIIVWLGEQGTDKAKRALEFVGKFTVPNTLENYHHRHRLIAASALARKAGHGHTILLDLFRRSWFERIWTLQEMVLSLNHTILVCGNTRVPWTSFIYALSWLADLDKEQFSVVDKYCRPYLVLQSMALEAEIGLSASIASSDMETIGIRDLGSNLFDFVGGLHGAKRATDPRDMIFGIYGLAQRLGYNISPPDYQRSVREVFIGAAMSIIEYDNDLRILMMAQHLRQDGDLPSWVPDWSVRTTPRQGLYLENAKIPPFRLLQSPSAYTFSPDGARLTVKGRILDKVVRAGRLFPDPSICRLHTWAIFQECVEMLQGRSTARDEELWEATGSLRLFEDALLGAALDLTAADPDEDYRRGTFISLCSMATLSCSEIRDIVAVGNAAIHEMDAEDVAVEALELLLLSPDAPKTGEFGKLYSLLGRVLEGKCFFISSHGWMGTAFGTVREGDVVAVLVGLDMPVVLSPDCEGNFRFVGLAYVPEIRKNGVRAGSKPNLRRITLV